MKRFFTLRNLVIGNVVLVLLAVGLFALFTMIKVPVTIEYVSLEGVEKETVRTNAHSYKDLQEEITAANKGKTLTFPELEDESNFAADTIQVQVSSEIQAKIGGKKQTLTIQPGTVKENLKANKISYDKDDIIKPALDKDVSLDMKLTVDYVEVKTKDKKKVIKAKDEVVFDPSISSGTIQETEGVDGEGLYRTTTTYVNGKKTKSKTKLVKTIKKATNNSVKFGTSQTGETGEVSYSETFTGECTAYTASKGARGSTGQLVHYGTCAVDPSVIPYGTKLYVEGYGVAVANDTGGAVKGHIIDLYMNSTSACLSWGRRNKKVYVLE